MNAPPTTLPAPPPLTRAPRPVPNAAHAFGGIWRLTSRRFFTPGYWAMLVAMLAGLVVFSIPAADNRVEAATGLLPWAAGFYVCFLLPILSFIGGAGAMRDDLGAGTVDYVFTRPVTRRAYIAFRYLAQMACTQIDFLFALGVVAGLGLFWQVPGLWSAMPLLLLAQVVGIIVFTAAGFFCGLLTTRYIIVGLLYGAVIEIGVGNVPTQLNQISLLRHLLAILRPILGESGWALDRFSDAEPSNAFAAVGLLLAVAAALVALTAVLFSFREFAGSARDN